MTGVTFDTESSIASALRWAPPPAGVVLPPGEIHVFAFAMDLASSRARGLERLLSHDELDRAERFRLERDGRRYVVGRARLRTILGRYVNRDPARLRFSYGSHGKPTLRAEPGGDRIRFNLSRSDGLGLLALQLVDDLGVDIERIRPFPDALHIAERFFSREEHEALRSLPSGDRSAAFFRYWTRKEAVVKSIGRGLSHPFDTFTLSRDPGESAELVVVEGEAGTATRWSLPVPEPCAGYVAALATAGSPRPVKCWTWADQ